MKKMMLVVMMLVMMLAGTAKADEVKALGTVVKMWETEWMITVEANNNLWDIETDSIWNEGDLMVLTFEDYDNDIIEDDEVIEVEYLFNEYTKKV